MAELPKILTILGGFIMLSTISSTEKVLDKEWAALILYALEIGISIEEIKGFFNKQSRPE